MFKQIRKRITIFNLFTLIIFLFIFISVLLFIIWWSFRISGEAYLINRFNQIVGEEEVVTPNGLINTTFHENLGSNYIIWNSNDGIEFQNISNNNLIKSGYRLVENNEDGFHYITINKDTYRVYTHQTDLDKEKVTIQIFQNITAESSLIPYLIFYLIVIGIIGIAALIPISYLLAGKSLVPIKKSFEDQKKFIADASHELRSPLTVITSSVDVMSLRPDTLVSDNQKWLDNISLESENLSKLISEMLLIAQADNNRLHFETQSFDLSELSNEISELMRTQLQDRDLSFITLIEPDILLNADKDKIRQLIRIFLDNAIKYTPDGGQILFQLVKDKKAVKLIFKDNGIGISKQNQEKIFERFFRCDNARGRDKGSGLGLNIAKTLVDYYKGNINIESEIGKGTTFSVTLPSSG